jgi:penicillin-binding protein 2
MHHFATMTSMALDLFGNPKKPSALQSAETPEFHGDLPPLDTSAVPDAQTPRRSFPGFTLLVIITAVALTAQSFRLQVLEAAQNRTRAEGNSVTIISTPPERGLIVDRNGVILAQNSRQLALQLKPEQLPRTKAERQAVYVALQKFAQITPEETQAIEVAYVKNELASTVLLKLRLTKEEGLLYREYFATTPGIALAEIPIRQYKDASGFGHLFGYVSTASENDLRTISYLRQGDQTGKDGLEKTYDTVLRGTEGKSRAEVDATGQVLRLLANPQNSEPLAGQTLKLGIDARLQEITTQALQRELELRTKKYGEQPTRGASAVAIDPRTGVIRAMVSLPDYSGNLFAKGISTADYTNLLNNPAKPLLNRSVDGQFGPASTLKPLVLASALQEGTIKESLQVVTPEAITIGDFRFPDWKVHGLTNPRKAIAESNNIFFYALGGGWQEKNIQGLGVDRLQAYLNRFGLGEKSGIDLPSESTGLVPGPAWKKEALNEDWYIGNTYQMAIGQGYLLATPLQMANATAAIANGGTVYKPRLVESLVDPLTKQETFTGGVVSRSAIIDDRNLQVVREGMRLTVTGGSAQPLNKLSFTSAGKTGTSQFGDPNGLTTAWYTGYAPYENPELAFAIVVEGAGSGYQAAIPVAESILRAYFNTPLQPGEKLFSEQSEAEVSAIAAEFRGER